MATRLQERVVDLQKQIEQLQSELMTSVANERQSALRAEAAETGTSHSFANTWILMWSDKNITEQRLQLALDRASEQLAELQTSSQKEITKLIEHGNKTNQLLRQQLQAVKQAYRNTDMELMALEKIIPQ